MRYALLLLALLVPLHVSAQQSGFGLEGGLWAGIPTGDLSDVDADTGVGIGVTGTLQVGGPVEVYLGWSRTTFDLAGGSLGLDLMDSGLRYGIGLRDRTDDGIRPFLRAGLLYAQATLEVEVDGASDKARSDAGPGVEVSGGLEVPLGRHTSMVPFVGFRSYDAPFGSDRVARPEIKVQHVQMAVFLRVAF